MMFIKQTSILFLSAFLSPVHAQDRYCCTGFGYTAFDPIVSTCDPCIEDCQATIDWQCQEFSQLCASITLGAGPWYDCTDEDPDDERFSCCEPRPNGSSSAPCTTGGGPGDRDFDKQCKVVPFSLRPKSGGGGGDPHFKRWNGEWYDFHGLCDLVLLSSPLFGDGMGLNIHIRTKPRYEYSYIESAAIQIGEDVLEVASYGQYFLNGVEGAQLSVLGNDLPVSHTMENKKKHTFVIKADKSHESIVITTFKDMVSVTVENATSSNFGSSIGMMGDFENGSLRARDGATIVDDHVLFGQEWQVLDSEPRLFQASTSIHQGCAPPSITKEAEQRRLSESAVDMEAAKKACAHFSDKGQQDRCIFDVRAMNDLEVAEVHGSFF